MVKYFGTTAFLAQSPQLYKQMAIAGGLERVFEIGPAFRAEPSFTSRHETEFTSIDMEVGWARYCCRQATHWPLDRDRECLVLDSGKTCLRSEQASRPIGTRPFVGGLLDSGNYTQVGLAQVTRV